MSDQQTTTGDPDDEKFADDTSTTQYANHPDDTSTTPYADDPDDASATQYAEEKHDILTKLSEKGKQIENTNPRKKVCPDYFGVKSYLHNFYETATYKDPKIYEDDDDFRYLLNPNARRRRCPSVWLKICIWLGVNLVFFGAAGILIGYLVPPKIVIHQIEGGGRCGVH